MKTSNNDLHYLQPWQVQKGMQPRKDRACPEEDKDSMVLGKAHKNGIQPILARYYLSPEEEHLFSGPEVSESKKMSRDDTMLELRSKESCGQMLKMRTHPPKSLVLLQEPV